MNKEAMSKQDSGRKGGQARASAYSVVQLSAQAKQSAITVEKRYPGFHCKIGVKGGGRVLRNIIMKNYQISHNVEQQP